MWCQRRLWVLSSVVVGAALATCPLSEVHAAERGSPPERRGPRVGIDTTFGDRVRAGALAHYRKNYARAVTFYTQALAMNPDRKNAAMLYDARAHAFEQLRNDTANAAD